MGIGPFLRKGRSLASASFFGRAFRRASFDNRDFWNDRYVTNPVKGSGPGSRGDNLEIKAGLIRSCIERHHVETVLDIGCGDIAVVSAVPMKNYVGIDISEVIVERNRQSRPDWTFVCADLTADYVPPQADLVLCLDVLIHQKHRRAYLSILSKALAAAGRIALVSGYPRFHRGSHSFFHEPLAESVARLCPDRHIDRVAHYRETDLLMIAK